jgi:hypothetical protein
MQESPLESHPKIMLTFIVACCECHVHRKQKQKQKQKQKMSRDSFHFFFSNCGVYLIINFSCMLLTFWLVV